METATTDRELADALMALGQLTRRALAESSRDLGYPVQQIQALCRLADGARSMSELANDLGLTRSSATELVDRLGRRSWVRRGADPADRRTSRVTLTTAGAAIAEHAHASVTERLGGATARLATAERRALTDAIGRILSRSA